MQEAGKVERVAASGRAIVRLSHAVDEGAVLCDARGSAVARVAELIGPVSAPFASAAPMTNSIAKHVGRRVYGQEGGGGRGAARRERGGGGRPGGAPRRQHGRRPGGGGGAAAAGRARPGGRRPR